MATSDDSSTAIGALMAAEVDEQPAVWAEILDNGMSEIAAIAAAIEARQPRFVMLVARGTSDHAALYAKYLVEMLLGLPAGLASPSSVTVYGTRPDLRDVLLVGISQSGGSTDLVTTMAVGRAQGALTLAITNSPGSALDAAAELNLSLHAGTERAVAATKSYTAQLLTLYLLLDRMRGGDGAEARELPALGGEVLGAGLRVRDLAARYRFAQRLVVTGRGLSYPTAREAALKLMETSYVAAQAFSGADLLHGPMAMVDAQIPVLIVLSEGAGGRALAPVVPRLHEAGADVMCVGTSQAVAAATVGIALPAGVPELLSPLVEIIPFQQLALHIAVARGVDPDAPRGLQKVTRTV
jgi:glucosamine--fructose-6-phosphate aminotransferase (isomerizing)